MHRPHLDFKYHDVRIWTDPRGEIRSDGTEILCEWHIECLTCGGPSMFRFGRLLGRRRTFDGANALALRHRAGTDQHAKYLIAHPQPPEPNPGLCDTSQCKEPGLIRWEGGRILCPDHARSRIDRMEKRLRRRKPVPQSSAQS